MNDTVHKSTVVEFLKLSLAELARDMETQRAVLNTAKLATAHAQAVEVEAASDSKAADRAFNEAVNALRPKRPRTAKLGEKP